MKLGTSAKAVIRPMVAPAQAPMRIVRSKAGTMGIPPTIITATSMPQSAVTEPTERSILPVRMTKVMPIATTPTTAACWKRLVILVTVMKLGDSAVAIATTARKIRMKLYSIARSIARRPEKGMGGAPVTMSVMVMFSKDLLFQDPVLVGGRGIESRDVAALVEDPDAVAGGVQLIQFG